MNSPKQPRRTINKEQSTEGKSFFKWGKGTVADTAPQQPPPNVDSEPDAFKDLRPTILQVRTAELFQLFLPLVLLVLLITYIASASYGLSRISRALADVRGSTKTNVANPLSDQIASLALQTDIQADTVSSLGDALRANPDRSGDDRRREAKSSPALPALDSQLGRLQDNIAAMRSQIDDLRSMMSEQEARDPYPGGWAHSQVWYIVLFNSTDGYNAKFLYPSVEDFFIAYGSTGDYSIKVIRVESQETELILTVNGDDRELKLPSKPFADPLRGTTEKPDEIVGDILRRLPDGNSQPQCLLIVSGRCPVPSSDQWLKLRVHACVLDDQNQPEQLRRKWEEFCRQHGGGLCEIVPFKTNSKFDIQAAGGRIRGWMEAALRFPPRQAPPTHATSD